MRDTTRNGEAQAFNFDANLQRLNYFYDCLSVCLSIGLALSSGRRGMDGGGGEGSYGTQKWIVCHFNDAVVNGKCEMESESKNRGKIDL